MRARVMAVGLVGTLAFGISVAGEQSQHLNPMIELLSAKKGMFGLGLPTAGRQGGGGNRGGRAGAQTPPATPAPPPAPAPAPRTPADLAKDAIAHPESDWFFTAAMERSADAGEPMLTAFQDAMAAAGPVGGSPRRLLAPINSKAPNITRPGEAAPSDYINILSRQLNVGISSISFVEVDTAEELRLGINALRFASKGGTRPEHVGNAPKYWGLSEAEYRRKADVWPLNPEGEIVVWAIIESHEGLANIREIAQVPGLSVIAAGAGTLGGVFSKTDADGRRVRDDAAWEAAIQKIADACKEFNKACAYPVNENDLEARYKQGFTVGILQSFNDAAFRAVAKGRQVAGR
jgi:4-hydroxy-2-oxoheptanedioate aldolase